jgi:hypothetical protein
MEQGIIARSQGDYETAHELLDLSRRLAREANDRRGLADVYKMGYMFRLIGSLM